MCNWIADYCKTMIKTNDRHLTMTCDSTQKKVIVLNKKQICCLP